MKLIIQIPCKDEEDHLQSVLDDLPRSIPGVDRIETLVVDDGSTDATTPTAVRLGVDHVLRFETNRGLARTFETGLHFAAHALKADIIVNTDGDHQYRGEYIPALVAEILKGDVGMVVGRRNYEDTPHFPRIKKWLLQYGSKGISLLAGFPAPDAPSGFRAFSGKAAKKLTVLSRYTYTMETLVQAKAKGIKVRFVEVKTNPKRRDSRLMKGILDYLWRTLVSLTAIVALYEPVFLFLATVAFSALLGLASLAFGGVPTLSFTAGGLLIAGAFSCVVSKIVVTHRIKQEEVLLWMIPERDEGQWAELLGANAYYRAGRKILPGTKCC